MWNQREEPWDVVVVGASAAGCALAHRLAVGTSLRVLLVDSGDDGTGALSAAPIARGNASAYAEWVERGNAGWGYDDLLPFFIRSERFEGGASELRGGEGPLPVAFCLDPAPAHRAYLAAVRLIGFKGDQRFDFNQPIPLDTAAFFQKTMVEGRPVRVSDAFINPIVDRPNFGTELRVRATKVVIENGRAVGVELVRNGGRRVVRATKAVALCGGGLESPRLLLRSGVGPAAMLREAGVAVVADVPGVGQNLQRHIGVSVRWAGTIDTPPSTVTAAMFTRSSQAAAYGPPDLMMRVDGSPEGGGTAVTMDAVLVRPGSRGSLKIVSDNPFAPPTITSGALAEAGDVAALVRGIQLARYLAEADAMSALCGDELLPGSAIEDRADLADFVRKTAVEDALTAGTCAMGPASDPLAVVDPGLKVRGVEGLFVADASVMPGIINAPLVAAEVGIGERAAALLAG